MTAIATDSATAAAVIAAMTSGTGSQIRGSGLAMIAAGGGRQPACAGGMIHSGMTIVAGCRGIPVAAIQLMTVVAGRGTAAHGAVWRAGVGPAGARGNLASGGAEVTSVATDSAAATAVITAMTGGTGIDILGCGHAMVTTIAAVQPGRSSGVIHGEMAIMAGSRTIAGATATGVTSITGSDFVAQTAVRGTAVNPAGTRRDLTSGRSEVAAVATHSTAAAAIITAMTLLAGINILLCSCPMISRVAAAQPGRSGGMIHRKMAIMAGGRAIAVSSTGGMAGIASADLRAHASVRSTAMDPTRTRRDSIPGRPEMAAVTTHPNAAAAVITAVALLAGVNILDCCSTMITRLISVQPGGTTGVAGIQMTIVTGCRTCTVKPFLFMAGVAGCTLIS